MNKETREALCAKFAEIHLDKKSTDGLTTEEVKMFLFWIDGWQCGSNCAFDAAIAVSLGARSA